MKNSLFIKTAGALLIATTPTLALAGQSGAYHYARVVNAEPVTRVVTNKIPHQSCWQEEVDVVKHKSNRTPTLLGAIIGGGLGNAVGHNSSNQKVGAVVGAVLGASVANDISRNRHSAETYTVTEQRCKTEYEIRETEKVVGYRVSYEYGDRIYHTRMDQHPGKRVKVKVEVTPVY